MHIGVDCRLAYYRAGGISRYTIDLISALASLEPTHQYAVIQSDRDRIDRCPPTAPNLRRVDVRTPSHHRLERLLLGTELETHRLDVLHSPDFIPPALNGVRRIVTVPDLHFLTAPEHLTAESLRYYRDQLPWALETADHVIVLSQHTRRELLARCGMTPERASVIYPAASVLFEQAASPASVDLTLERLELERGFVLFVGTIEPRKNLRTLIDACALMSREGVDRQLVLVGRTGWQDREIAALIDGAVKDGWVRHLRDLDDERLRDLYAAAGTLALPSFDEGFGLPVLEAMHGGCPVVASTAGALPEVVGEAGLLVDPLDTRAWADAIARVLTDDSLRTELQVHGRTRAQQFSWREAAEATLAVYLGSAAV